MYSEDVYYGLPLTISGSGHVPQQDNILSQTTVNPADLFLAQSSHGPTQPYAIHHINVASTDHGFVGYPVVDDTLQGVSLCHPLMRVAQSVDHTSVQFSVINDVPEGYSTGPQILLGRVSRASSIKCGWISEDLSSCGQTINRGTVPKHLAQHGIRNMHKDRVVECRWQGCGAQIKRQSITRHAREVHLGSKRKSHVSSASTFVTDVL